MATTGQIRDAVRKAVDYAIKDEPYDTGMRARLFVAGLQGSLSDIDPQIAAYLEHLRYPNGRPTDEAKGD